MYNGVGRHFGLLVLSLSVRYAVSQNTAFGKPAFSNGIFGGISSPYSADKAVDGVRGFVSFSCALLHNDNGELSRWWVDLQDSYRVQRVTIYNADGTIGGRLGFTNFTISVGPDLLNLINCGDTYTDPPLPAKRHVNISCDQVGRFVVFRKLSPGVLIALCEVEVHGITEYDCSLCPAGVDCTPSAGCSQCSAGLLPPGCVLECSNGTYGVGCSSRCGQCVSGTVCDKMTGVCPRGCQLWWTGDKCDTEIVTPRVANERIRLVGMTNNSAIVEWDALASVPSELAEFYKYRVRYKERTQQYQDRPLVSHGSSPLSAELTGLKHDTEYDFAIDTYRVMGASQQIGESYSFVTGRTRCNSPEMPSITAVIALDGTDLFLGPVVVTYMHVSRIEPGCFNISSVQVQYRHVDISEYTTKEADISNTAYTIRVSVSGEYEVRLVVTNNEGLTAASEPHTVTVAETRQEPPTTPSSAMVVNKLSDTVVIVVAVVVVAGVALVVIVVTFLGLKHRRHVSGPTDSPPERTYVNQAAVGENRLQKSQPQTPTKNVSSQGSPPADAGNSQYESVQLEALPDKKESTYQGLQHQAGSTDSPCDTVYHKI